MRQGRLARSISGVLLILIAAMSSASADHKRCGVIVPLTGPMASVGTSIMNSVILADKQLDGSEKVQFLFEDDQFSPTNTVSAVHKLVKTSQVQCLILFGSTTSLAAAEIVERMKVPTIAIAITPKVTEGREYIVRHYLPVTLQVEKIRGEISRRGYGSIAIVSTIQDAALALREELLRAFQGRIELDQQFVPGDTDFKTVASKIARLEPDAVMLNLLPPQMSVMARQLRQSGFKGEFFSGPFLGNRSEVVAAGNALLGAWFVTNDDRAASRYYAAYREQFGSTPEIEGTNGYDAAKVFLQVIDAKDPNGELHRLANFQGVLGSYSVHEKSFLVPAGLRQVEADGFVRIE